MNKILKDSNFKVAIIGCGNVGSTVAFSLVMSELPVKILLIDRNLDKAEGEKLDLIHGLPLIDYGNQIEATDDYKNIKNCDLVVVTAGFSQIKGESRLSLAERNLDILEEILPKVVKVAPETKILLVTNPVDVLTQRANEIISNAGGRVFGSGTLLDTIRFRYYLSKKIFVSPKDIHAYILGEHGDNSFPVYEYAEVGGQRLLDFPGINSEIVNEAYLAARNSAAEIISKKGATYYAIGVVVMKIVEAILNDSKVIYPLSVPLMDYYGYSNVCLSVPCVLGKNGVERVLKIKLSEIEKNNLATAVEVLKNRLK